MKNFLHNTWKHRAHVVMALPAFLVLLFFAYIPMGGLVMAFKSYDYTKGIWGSPWNGIDNFKFLIASKSYLLFYLLLWHLPSRFSHISLCHMSSESYLSPPLDVFSENLPTRPD